MRIIAGQFKGRPLIPPKGKDVRPTSDRTRESLFNLLMHGRYGGENLVGRPAADLCCGTGALGLEALSRGAASCLFLDRDTTLAKTNAQRLGILDGTRGGPTGPTMQQSEMRGDESRSEKGRRDAPLGERSEPKARFLTGDITKLPDAPEPYALILLDAPYEFPALASTLAQLVQRSWLTPDALICVEQAKFEKPHEVDGLTLEDVRNYGKASIRLYRRD